MKHFLFYIGESIKENWNAPALSNYGANTFTYGDVASFIKRYHILFEKCGIVKGDKVALCARNSAEWCIAYFAIASYEAVAVPLLPDFLPQNVLDLTRLSDSRLLLTDASILNGLKRDKVLSKFNDLDNFCGVVDIIKLEQIAECNSAVPNLSEEVDKCFKSRYPNGVTQKHIDFGKGI